MSQDLVSGDGWISDESSLYGSEDERRAVSSALHVGELPKANLKNTASTATGMPDETVEMDWKPTQTVQLFDHFKERFEGRQLSESVQDFLLRLPVNSTDPATVGPWIWIANPHDNHPVRGSDVEKVVEEGRHLLEGFEETRKAIERENAGKSQSTIIRKLGPQREELKDSILKLAKDHGVTSGKWMLFPDEKTLAETWRLVAEGVAEGRLGDMAKVATESNGRGRLICVYTKDFSDMEDVRRVLKELVRLELVKPDMPRGIYYKCDAYTHLGIESANDYGLRASLYGSKEMLVVTPFTQSRLNFSRK